MASEVGKWAWWKPIVDYDPAAVLSNVHVPVRATFGAAGAMVPHPAFGAAMVSGLATRGWRRERAEFPTACGACTSSLPPED